MAPLDVTTTSARKAARAARLPSPARSRLRRWSLRLAIALAAIALLLVAAWLAVPPLARAQLESRLTAALHRPTTVQSVAFDPFALRLTVRDLVVAAPAGPPLFAADAIVADLSLASLRHRAPVLDALKLLHPVLTLGRDAAGRYSVQDLIDAASAPPANGADEGPPRFSLNNVEVVNGQVAFDDGVTGRHHVLAALDLGVPFLSSLPYETDVRVAPRISGTMNGSPFAVEGSVTPFATPREALLDIDVDALPLAPYLVYLPGKLRVGIAGTLTTRLKLATVSGGQAQRLELRGDAHVDKLSLTRGDGTALAQVKRIDLVLERVDLLARNALIAKLGVEAPSVDVKRLRDGSLEWAQPLVAPAAASPPAAAPAQSAWRVVLGQVGVGAGRIEVQDESTGFRSTLSDVTVEARNVTNRADATAHLKASFSIADAGASFVAEADVQPVPVSATGRIALTNLPLTLLAPYQRPYLAGEVQRGSLDLSATFAMDAQGDVKLREGELGLRDLRVALPRNRAPLFAVQRLAVHGAELDLGRRELRVAAVETGRGTLRLVREQDGSLEIGRLLKSAASPPPRRAEATKAATPEPAWSARVDQLTIAGYGIDVEDRVPKPAVKLALRDLSGTVTSLGTATSAPMRIVVRTRIGDRGRVAFNGPVTVEPLRVSGSLDAAGLTLAPLQPYLTPHTNIVLTGGALSAKGRLQVEARAGAPLRAGWKGDIGIADFAALDQPTHGDLARWKNLALEGMDLATAPFALRIARVGLDDFFARAIVYQDGTLNLVRLAKAASAAASYALASDVPARGYRTGTASGATATVTQPPGASAPSEPLPVTIGAVEFRGGNVNFSDYFIRPNYSVNLTDVTGSISAMSPEQAGDVSVVARVDHLAPVEVQGHFHPFAAQLSLDIAAKARDVDLPPLTPYSAKYAGYGIEKGKLTFDVHYKVEARKLSAENHLVLDQLTFGPRVDSPTATKLPVLLAVSLLKDAKGVIDIRLPIGGSLDDPKFSIGGLIVRVIVNLITKAVTAPFALLSAVFGGGEELSTLPFAPGSSALMSDARKRVDTLGKALADRPALKLDIGGRAEAAGDREALLDAGLEDLIKRARMKTLVREGTAPASVAEVTIPPEERARWLREAYRDAPLPDRPRNFIRMLKDVPPADMQAMLRASVKVDDDTLRGLANARAQAVKSALEANGIAGERLFIVAPRVEAAAAGGARVDLALH
jgi:uncharacterized protein involved in outer membrane biogenesis